MTMPNSGKERGLCHCMDILLFAQERQMFSCSNWVPLKLAEMIFHRSLTATMGIQAAQNSEVLGVNPFSWTISRGGQMIFVRVLYASLGFSDV